ncbi:MAG: hypothetical protein ACOY3K_05095 [Candidatus Omnitrophota bacterium]
MASHPEIVDRIGLAKETGQSLAGEIAMMDLDLVFQTGMALAGFLQDLLAFRKDLGMGFDTDQMQVRVHQRQSKEDLQLAMPGVKQRRRLAAPQTKFFGKLGQHAQMTRRKSSFAPFRIKAHGNFGFLENASDLFLNRFDLLCGNCPSRFRSLRVIGRSDKGRLPFPDFGALTCPLGTGYRGGIKKNERFRRLRRMMPPFEMAGSRHEPRLPKKKFAGKPERSVGKKNTCVPVQNPVQIQKLLPGPP